MHFSSTRTATNPCHGASIRKPTRFNRCDNSPCAFVQPLPGRRHPSLALIPDSSHLRTSLERDVSQVMLRRTANHGFASLHTGNLQFNVALEVCPTPGKRSPQRRDHSGVCHARRLTRFGQAGTTSSCSHMPTTAVIRRRTARHPRCHSTPHK